MKFQSLFLAFTICTPAICTADYDLVINNGRVMDPETLYDNIANVGIKDGRIAAITKDTIKGKETINAKGLVVAPGFIDTHFHATDPFGQQIGVADGITTGMDLEHGAIHVNQWYDKKAEEGQLMNYGTTAIMIGARMAVHDPEVQLDGPYDISTILGKVNESAKDGTMGWAVTPSNVDQMNQVMKILDEDLRAGALGIGVGAAYMAKGLTTYEQFEAQRTAARYGRFTSAHTRFHMNGVTPTEAPIGVSEILANAMTLRAPLLVCHDNDYGWWENQEKLQLARAQGFNVWGEYYPFTAGSTAIAADFLKPELWEKANGNKYEETMYDPAMDKFYTKQEYLDMVTKEPGRLVIAFAPKRKAWLPMWLRTPGMTVASDGMPGFDSKGNLLPAGTDVRKYQGHPRVAATYSTTLELARQEGVPLMFTLAQLSYTSAKHLGDTGLQAMKERGRVQVGKIADLTIFDPDKIAPRATYKKGENALPPIGLPYVVIGGKIVVKNSVVQKVKAGQSIRFPVEEKGRFEPVTVNGWYGEHTINVPKVHDTEDNPVLKHR
ncbi:amidohydrolase family protein [Shewanella spartinae]|uniref:amidohydrolase family protein n=1 Tax=Shewanella spartinae TaxID=2864205 RepID=UPI001C656D12|nr:amidohydrolase family protein [Shewanella spartinae]QYJ93630.1 hypothetical protein K0I31_18970 [Shewanella spartinae]